SGASASASASKAILIAEARAQTARPEELTAAPVESNSIVVLSAAGEVARLPLPETDSSEVQAKPQVAPKAQAVRTQGRRVASPASSLGPENSQLHAEVSKVKQELPAP